MTLKTTKTSMDLMLALSAVASGCVAVRDQQTVGSYGDSGFAKNQSESNEAERIGRTVNGVRDVRNNLIVKP